MRHVVHGFLQKKREFEPDPVEEVPPPEVTPEAVATVVDGVPVVAAAGGEVSFAQMQAHG